MGSGGRARSCLLLLLAAAAPAEPRLSFADAVQRAWLREPDRLALEGQRAAAAARASAAHALFPNAPFATAQYDDDHVFGNNQGYTTYAGSVNTPLWLPGEGTATARSAQAEATRIAAQGEAGRLAVATQVLDAAALAMVARNAREVAARRLAAARALLSQSARLVRAGESALVDQQAAGGDVAAAEIAGADADVQLLTATRALAELTGTGTLPDLAPPRAPGGEGAPARADVDARLVDRTPQVVAAQRGVDAAEAELRLVRLADRDDPEVGIEGIRDKQFGSPWDLRFGVVVRVPFASRARNLPRIAAAQSARTTAEAALLRARRLVQLAIAQSRAQLDAGRRSRDAALSASRQLCARAGEIERAWRLGEMPLIEVIRAQQASFDAALVASRTSVAVDVAALRASLAEGVVP